MSLYMINLVPILCWVMPTNLSGHPSSTPNSPAYSNQYSDRDQNLIQQPISQFTKGAQWAAHAVSDNIPPRILDIEMQGKPP
ncbi:hypothetical protein DSO57_1024966 [Entomophthora muscae]|uniref:Uncharacterized protein n=1 Tax=Entomophthora muscae TaxID=34485 RepID=A0ACC2RTL2_9FUNG|nr:hypothetical protein DSO57_1024966 [Entomophthora muscae]